MTGTETDRPVEELKKINKVFGTEFLGISFRGKKNMCLLALEKMSDANYDEVSYFCSKNKKGALIISTFKTNALQMSKLCFIPKSCDNQQKGGYVLTSIREN